MRAMNGRDWIRRHSAATSVAPDRNGAGPAEAVRIREREAETAASAGLRPQARRLLQPLPLVGVLLVLIALVGYWSVYRASTKRTPVLVAAHALSAGSALHASDLGTGELAGDGRTMAALVPARELEALSVGSAPSGIDSAAASVPITLALPDPSLASALALANSDAKLDLLRESGRARAAPIPSASEAGP